jgi:hypothetical protein
MWAVPGLSTDAQTGKKAIDVCPDGECKVMLWDYEEGGNPNKPADEME